MRMTTADETKYWYCYDTDGRILEQRTTAGNCA
jgi:YD repeat-containing protein